MGEDLEKPKTQGNEKTGMEQGSDTLAEGSITAEVNEENSAPGPHINQQEREDVMKETVEISEETAPAGGSWVKKNKMVLIAVSVLLLISASTGIALGVYTRDDGLITEGVKISGVPVGTLTKEQATAKVDEKIKHTLAQGIKFNVDGHVLEINLEQLGFNQKAAEALEQAYKVGREGAITKKAADKRKATQGIEFNLKSEWDDKKLSEALSSNFNKFNQPAQEASFTINSQNTMDIKESKVGRLIDINALAAKVKAEDIYAPQEIKVEFKEDQPKLSKSTLESQKITGLISTYTTKFDASQLNRSENLRLAAKALDGFVIKPGDTFSFNDAVGPRSADTGYKDAYVIVNGEFVPGLGGGICQVSSTLYNSVLLADLSLVEHNNHSLAITYVPLGRDATVAYPSLDFKFKNDSGGYLLIRSRFQGSNLTFDLYGQPKPDREVVITTSTEQTLSPGTQQVLDNNLAPGAQVVKQGGQPGYVVSSTRIVKVKGAVVKTENLGKSKYQPLTRIVAHGP